MKNKYDNLRDKAFSALHQLAKQNPDYDQMRMIIGAADADASLRQRAIHKSIDTDWIARVEEALPALDIIIRTPTVAIEDQEEVVAVELTRVISEKSIKHLAQHTNLIREINDDEIIPSHILNVFREESFLTYENKFINTLLSRLWVFVDRRYRALVGGSGVEQDYDFKYGVKFDHFTEDNRRTEAKVKLQIQLTAPAVVDSEGPDAEINEKFASALARAEKIHQAVNAYLSSPFAQKLGKNYIRPPVIRTNAILKNKNFKDCLLLWEFIEGYEKAGYSISGEEFAEKPSDVYVSDLYSLMALQYTQFYGSVVDRDVDILAKRQLNESEPEFNRDFNVEEELDDYLVYDSEYKKTVPVSRLMNNRKKLSEDERRIRDAIEIAIRADEIINAELLKAEEEERRLERERIAEEKARLARLAAMEEAAKRGPIPVTYKRSFLSKLIQAGEQLQANYTAIKNELLNFDGVSSRISWKHESFRRGRDTLSRVLIKGKNLYLYLALSPEEHEGATYVSNASEKYSDTRLLVKVRSPRSLRFALTLIDLMMERLGAARIEREQEDYSMPYADTDELVKRGLIKMILPPGVTINEFDKLVKLDFNDIFTLRDGAEEEGKAPIIEVVEESTPPAAADEADEAADFVVVPDETGEDTESADPDALIPVTANEFRDSCSSVREELLCYEGVTSHTSWRGETFKRGGRIIARLSTKRKYLYLYLALPPEEYEGIVYASDETHGKYSDTTLLLKVRSPRSLKCAFALIADMMERNPALETSAQDTSASENTAPETSAQETSASDDTAPETSAQETSASDDTAPETSAQETSASDDTAPEASAQETSASDENAEGNGDSGTLD